MIELKQIYQRFLQNCLLLAIIIPSILLSQEPPEEFQFNQSTLQAFYYFTEVTLNGASIESDDWVAAFKGDVCVGARLWDTSGFCSDPTYIEKSACENEGETWTWNLCNGGICDVPTMGDDDSEYAIGYMQAGEIPTFKIYDASSGNILNAIPSLDIDLWSTSGFLLNDLLEAIIGCTDNTACNYNPNATEFCSDCCIYIQDCFGICGGTAIEDCASVCDGDAEVDDCGLCNGESVCPGDMMNEFGQCESDDYNVGEFNVNGFDCNGFCFGTQCFGSNTDNCYGLAGANECYDCANTPDGTAVLDECKTCSGGDSGHIANSEQDCTGECFGNSVLDECGVCDGDGLSCLFGCMDINATNYYCNFYECDNGQLPEGFSDDSTCTYKIEGSVEYYSNYTPIEDVLVTIYGSYLWYSIPIASAITDITGHFIIPHVPIRNTDENVFLYEYYYLEFSYTEITNNNHIGIQENDAQLISQVVISESSFEVFNDPIYSYIAADVNLDGRINSFDSSLIGRFLQNPSSFNMNESNTRWKFVSGTDTITNLSDNENIVIYGIKLGDSNGSWD